ncbi:MAG: FAD-binding protein, partial [Comamonadaceae bacterium]
MTPELLVAGGGIGGLAAALAATRVGCTVRVFEQAAQFGEVGAVDRAVGSAVARVEIRQYKHRELRAIAGPPHDQPLRRRCDPGERLLQA